MYSIKLLHGDQADFFLDEWKPGGIRIRDDVIGLYRTARGSGSMENLLKEAKLWQLAEVTLTMKHSLQIGFLPSWHWLDAGWTATEGSRLSVFEDHTYELFKRRLRDIHDDGRAKADVLASAMRLTKRLGDFRFIFGRLRASAAAPQEVTVYSQGLISYKKTPHPMAFLVEIVDILVPREEGGSS